MFHFVYEFMRTASTEILENISFQCLSKTRSLRKLTHFDHALIRAAKRIDINEPGPVVCQSCGPAGSGTYR